MSNEQDDVDYNEQYNQDEEEYEQQDEEVEQQENEDQNDEEEDKQQQQEKDEDQQQQENELEKEQDDQENQQDQDDEQNEDNKQDDGTKDADLEAQERAEVDLRSVYVQNVDYQCTKDDIIEHFKDVGDIYRVTILTDKYTGQPKGGAYIEFSNSESIEIAKGLSDSMLRGRSIKVVEKRTNIRGFNTKQRGKGRGIRRAMMGYPAPMYIRGNYMFAGYRGKPRGRGYRGPL